MKICSSLEDVIEFKALFPIVLKPFNEYGGRGIVKIDCDFVSAGSHNISFNDFSRKYESNPIEYLAVK